MSTKTKDDCKHEAGVLKPVINLNKCEGKEDCVIVCPFKVFEMRDITAEEQQQLNFIGKLKTMVHGKQKAYAVNLDACHACGLCVSACPEKAIKLARA